MAGPGRASSSTRLFLGAIALPLFLAGCLGESGTDTGDTSGQQGNDVVTENASDKIAFEYFVSKGLTDVQAAGIIGNLDQESGMSPTIAQYGGGPGRGIAQWSVGGRWDTSKNDNVAWYAAQQGGSIYSLDLQLEFIWYELTTFGYGYQQLRAATTVTAATDAFMAYYEICGACDASNRVAHAEAALSAFGGSSPTPPPSSGPTSCSVNGVAGTCIATSQCQLMADYVSTPGYCPGAANVECCTPLQQTSPPPPPQQETCSISGVVGTCMDVGACESMAGYVSTPGYCAGAANIECCTPQQQSSPPPPPPPPPSAQTCSVGGVEGTCVATGTCATMPGYVSTPGYCPGAANIECCTPPPSCDVGGVTGSCIETSLCAASGGVSTPGYCPGAADIECCTF